MKIILTLLLIIASSMAQAESYLIKINFVTASELRTACVHHLARGCVAGNVMYLRADHHVKPQKIYRIVDVDSVKWGKADCGLSLSCMKDGVIQNPFTRFCHARLGELGKAFMQSIGFNKYKHNQTAGHELLHIVGYNHSKHYGCRA